MASVKLAIIAAKATRKILRLFGKGATTLPGKVAIKLCPKTIELLSKDKKIITITGTNGKTTTSHMISEMLSSIGFDVINNISGANLASGVATTLICGRDEIKKSSEERARGEVVYVLETDEAAFAKIAGSLQPQVSVVTNLFRDQLDRYGELTHTRDCIADGIDKTKATLVVNSDDSLVASLGKSREDRTVFFGMDAKAMYRNNVKYPENKGILPASPDAVYCPECKVRYEYDARSFSHLGVFKCPKCGFSRPKPRFAVKYDLVTSPTDPDYSFVMRDDKRDDEKELKLKIPGTHNLYNTCAAISAVTVFLEKQKADSSQENAFEKACEAEAQVKAAFGRMEKFEVNGKKVCILLVKNPTGLDRSLSFVANARDAGGLFLLLNSNIADGKDVSWIWDVDFESKSDKLPSKLYVSGQRWADMLLRVNYAGRDDASYASMDEVKKLFDKAVGECQEGKCLYILPNYTSMLSLRAMLVKQYGLKDFWK